MADNLHPKCNVDKHGEYMAATKRLELEIQEIDALNQENYMHTMKLELVIMMLEYKKVSVHKQKDIHSRGSALKLHIESSPTKRNANGNNSASEEQRLKFPYKFFKLDMPRFDGTDSLGWIFKITHFFNYHKTLEEQRITIAFFYIGINGCTRMDKLLVGITSFKHYKSVLHHLNLMIRKGPSSNWFNPQLLENTGHNLKYYQTRIVGLSAQTLLSCFITGLKPQIRTEVQALQPPTLSQAIGLAKLQEDKFLDIRHNSKPYSPH